MPPLNTNISHGDLNVRIRHGGGLAGLIPTALIIGAAIGVAVVIVEYAWLIITLGAVAAAARLWLHHRRTLAITAIAAKGELIRAEQQARADAALERRERHELAVAAAGASRTEVHAHTHIDPAAITAAFAAAFTGAQPQPVPVPVRMIPGTAEEVRRG